MMQKKLSISLLLATLVAVSMGSNANASHTPLVDEDKKTSLVPFSRDAMDHSTSGLKLLKKQVGEQDGIVVSDEPNPSSATLKFVQTTEEPSPFAQPNYWRALLIKSATAGAYSTLFAADQPEIYVVGFVGLLGYMRYGGLSAFCKVVGAGVGGVIGGTIGGGLAQAFGDTRIVAPVFSAGVAVGYGASTMVLDSVSYGWKRLLGTTKTIKHQTYEIKK